MHTHTHTHMYMHAHTHTHTHTHTRTQYIHCENDGLSSVSADVLNTSSVATVLSTDERVQTLVSAVGDTLLNVHSVVGTPNGKGLDILTELD